MSFFNIHVVNVINQMVWRCTSYANHDTWFTKGYRRLYNSPYLQYTAGVKQIYSLHLIHRRLAALTMTLRSPLHLMHLCTFGALGAKVNEVSWLAQLNDGVLGAIKAGASHFFFTPNAPKVQRCIALQIEMVWRCTDSNSSLLKTDNAPKVSDRFMCNIEDVTKKI